MLLVKSALKARSSIERISLPFPCRLMIDPPQGGAWNMAVDEVLLHSATERGFATLRFYQWSEPTLSLGYFQPYLDRDRHFASQACPVVRRSSGGGAILHDREITYSLALPGGHPLAGNHDRLYTFVHGALVAVLNEFLGHQSGRIAQICTPNASPPPEPFMCFERRALGDVLLADTSAGHVAGKIAGSAQRRRKEAVLQHGSVLLAQSKYAPELPGILEFTQREMPPDELSHAWTARMRSDLPISPGSNRLAASERILAESFAAERFASSEWTNRR